MIDEVVMKIVWVCNVELPLISELCNTPISPIGGWLDETSRRLLSDGNELLILYRTNRKKTGNTGKMKFIGFTEVDDVIEEQIASFFPDIIHIWGTEYKHSFDIINYCKNINFSKIVISIQGMASVYGKFHYYANLPINIIYGFSIRDIIRKDNVYLGRKRFIEQGKYEIAAIQNVNNIIGRTRWDYACARLINKNVTYYKCNEILRKTFYKGKWEADKCEKHSIFFSQCHYPIKGFHIALTAFKYLVGYYPDLKVYVVGRDLNTIPFYKISLYQKYLLKIIKMHGLEDNIIFCGQLSAEEMRQKYLNCNVFVCASSVENSSNSIGEAMLLGCPIVASNVGGIGDLLCDEEDGFLYPFDEPYMLAYYVNKIFASDELASILSLNCQKHAKATHNEDDNYHNMIRIYRTIIES